jgi:hypothetical protein
MAGLTTSQYTVQVLLGSDQFSAAQQAITQGASMLIVDARYSGIGVRSGTREGPAGRRGWRRRERRPGTLRASRATTAARRG